MTEWYPANPAETLTLTLSLAPALRKWRKKKHKQVTEIGRDQCPQTLSANRQRRAHKLIADQAQMKMCVTSILYSQFHLSHAAAVLLFLVNHPSLQSIDLSPESWAAASGFKRSSDAFDLCETLALILSFQFEIEQTKTSLRDTLGFDSSGSAKTTESARVGGVVKWILKPKKILWEIVKAEYRAEHQGDLAIISIYLSNKLHHWNALSTYNSLQIFIYE